jgi:hypothetical protein
MKDYIDHLKMCHKVVKFKNFTFNDVKYSLQSFYKKQFEEKKCILFIRNNY